MDLKQQYMTNHELELQAEVNRRRLMEIVYNAKAGHIGGDLSVLNTLTALYFDVMNVDPENPKSPDRDRFVLSKGHCVEALYATLEAKGYFPKEYTDTLGRFGSPLSGHPTIEVPGIEVSSGALGHGLSFGVGMAIAAKMDGKPYRTFVVMGDGEQGEGSIYEAAMSASHYKLDNLVAVIDRNHLQISGNTEDVMAIENIETRWGSFGWDVVRTDGNSASVMAETIKGLDYTNGKPHLVIAETTKGKGVSYMENVAKWHHGMPDAEQYATAIEEIECRINEMRR